MSKFNSQGIPDSRQCSIDGIKEIVATSIILRSDPFGFPLGRFLIRLYLAPMLIKNA